LGVCTVERNAIRALIDDEKQGSLSHRFTFAKRDALQISAHTWPQFDRIDCFDATVKFVGKVNVLPDNRRDADFRQGRCVGLGALTSRNRNYHKTRSEPRGQRTRQRRIRGRRGGAHFG
jgi:hypothetical protein